MSTPTPELYHVAYLVHDLDRAIASFGTVTGQTFNTPTVATMQIANGWSDAAGDTETFRVAYTVNGPLHIELIEQTSAGVFGPDAPVGYHHAGYWVDDLDQVVSGLKTQGHRIETTVRTASGGLLAVFMQPVDTHDTRIELVASVYRARLEAWFRRVT